jgi:DNA helicase-2/ATP-dependent DNA helicase PcrA
MIESYPEYFLAYRAMSQMDDLECYEYIENIISPETHPKLCPLYQPTYWIRAIVQNIKTLRKEALSPEAFGEHIQTLKRDYSNALDEIDTKLKKYAVTKEKFDTHIARLLELKDIYEAYEIRKQREGKYDFDDMILYAAEELNKNDILASEMAEKYQFIMVDEFQDLSN